MGRPGVAAERPEVDDVADAVQLKGWPEAPPWMGDKKPTTCPALGAKSEALAVTRQDSEVDLAAGRRPGEGNGRDAWSCESGVADDHPVAHVRGLALPADESAHRIEGLADDVDDFPSRIPRDGPPAQVPGRRGPPRDEALVDSKGDALGAVRERPEVDHPARGCPAKGVNLARRGRGLTDDDVSADAGGAAEGLRESPGLAHPLGRRPSERVGLGVPRRVGEPDHAVPIHRACPGERSAEGAEVGHSVRLGPSEGVGLGIAGRRRRTHRPPVADCLDDTLRTSERELVDCEDLGPRGARDSEHDDQGHDETHAIRQ